MHQPLLYALRAFHQGDDKDFHDHKPAVQEQIERTRDPGEQDLLMREKFALAREIRALASGGLGEAAGQSPSGGPD